MAFSKTPRVPSPEKMLAEALKAGRATKVKGKKEDDPVAKARKKERERLTAISTTLRGRLISIPKGFMSMDTITPFYYALCSASFDIDAYREKLGRIGGAARAVSKMARGHRGKIEGAGTVQAVKDAMRSFIGRVSSLLEDLDKDLDYLEEIRRVLEGFPVVKERFTVCIAGFPNVGKTTLFCKLTGAGAEVNSYAFTTKRLNVTSARVGHHYIQFIDTPGTLNRDHMNTIEKHAHLALLHVADVIIYVYDPTDTYPLEQQDALREVMDGYGVPVVEYLSKTDIQGAPNIEVLQEKHEFAEQQQLLEIIGTYRKERT